MMQVSVITFDNEVGEATFGNAEDGAAGGRGAQFHLMFAIANLEGGSYG